jgi:hypothetical protein
MDTEAFFEAFLPTQGTLILAFKKTSMTHVSFQTDQKAKMAERTLELDAEGYTTYIALASFSSSQRKQKFARYARCLWIDVDVGKDNDKNCYECKGDARQAIVGLVKKIGLPTPTIVDSGNGYHVYFVFDTDIPINQWQHLSNQLKAALKKAGFKQDPVVTTDSARLLRPIGTHNYGKKKSMRVRMAHIGQATSPQEIGDILNDYLDVGDSEIDFSKFQPSGLFDSTLDLQINDYPPSSAPLIAENCLAIKEIANNPEGATEPAWRGMIGIVKHCIEGIELVHEWSKGHPDYNCTETEEKYRNWDAPPTTCEYFDDLGLCEGCIYRPSK